MNATQGLLSGILTGIGRAVADTQQSLDQSANSKPEGRPFAPLAFIVRKMELTLVGDFAVDPSVPLSEGVIFAKVDRVTACLRGSERANLSSRISLLIEAAEPFNGR
jgi:hypothetical protein